MPFCKTSKFGAAGDEAAEFSPAGLNSSYSSPFPPSPQRAARPTAGRRVALSSVTSTIATMAALSLSGQLAGAGAAFAAACTPGSANTYICSGAGDGTVDLGEVTANTGAAIDVENINVGSGTTVTVTGTVTNTAAHGIRINGVGAVNNGPLGGFLTIDAQDIVTGVRANASDLFTSGGGDGIQLVGNVGAAGAQQPTTITTGDLDVSDNGVNLGFDINRVDGETNVTTGKIIAGGMGVVIDSNDNADNYAINVNTGNVTSGGTGIFVNQSGTGSISVDTGDINAGTVNAGDVNSALNAGGFGVRLESDPHGSTVAGDGGADWDVKTGNITVTDRTTGDFTGTGIALGDENNGGNGNTTVTARNIQAGTGIIYNRNGTGTVAITTGDITAATGNGIQFGTNVVQNDLSIKTGNITAAGDGITGDTGPGGGATTIEVGSITSTGDGIDIIHSGTGSATITSTGTITSDNIGVNLTNDSLTSNAGATAGQNIITVKNIDTSNNTAINVNSNAVNGTIITTEGAINTPAENDVGGDGMRVTEQSGPLVINVAQGSTITSFNNTMELTNDGDKGTTVNVNGALRSTALRGSDDGVIWINNTPGTTTININDGSTVEAADRTGFAVTDNSGNSVVNVGVATVEGGFRLGAGNDALTFSGTDMTNVGTLDGGAGSTGGDILTLNDVRNLKRNLDTSGQEIENWDAVNLNGGTADLVGTLKTGVFTLGKDNAGNPAVLSIGAGTVGDTLTIIGNYIGKGGTVVLDTKLGGDGSPSDELVISGGTASGTTALTIVNVGGTGAQTTADGIKVVDAINGATTASTAFHLTAAVAAGAFDYGLHYGGVGADANDQSWYLRSTLAMNPVAQTALVEAAALGNLAEATLGTLQQRSGNRIWPGGEPSTVAADLPPSRVMSYANSGPVIYGAGAWGRIAGQYSSYDPTKGSAYTQGIGFLQAGYEGTAYEMAAGDVTFGAYGTVSTSDAEIKTTPDPVTGAARAKGKITTTGYGVGANATWLGNDGLYADGIGQFTFFQSDLSSKLGNDNQGWASALSLEVGKRFELGDGWTVVPQAQLAWIHVDFDSYTDSLGDNVSLGRGDSLKGRAGVRVEKLATWQDSEGKAQRLQLYGIANLTDEFLGGTKVNVAGASLEQQEKKLWGEVGLGANYAWNDKMSVYGEADYATALSSHAGDENYTVKGTVGLRYTW